MMLDSRREGAEIARIRSFNRTVTDRIGALRAEYLGRDRPLGHSRVLWQVDDGGTAVAELRARLGLDAGYLSRILRSLADEGLIDLVPDRYDRRSRTVRLTRAGRREREVLDRSSDALAASLLEPLSDEQRDRLVSAMAEVERLLVAGLVELAPEDPTTPTARWCIDSYMNELDERFDHGFDPSRSIPAEAEELTPPNGLLVVARVRDEPVGCGALKHHPGGRSEIKRMWVAPGARGLGLGRRLLADLEARAAAAGATALQLETNRSLVEAIDLYRTAGYREVERFNDEPYAHHWFRKDLTAPGSD